MWGLEWETPSHALQHQRCIAAFKAALHRTAHVLGGVSERRGQRLHVYVHLWGRLWNRRGRGWWQRTSRDAACHLSAKLFALECPLFRLILEGGCSAPAHQVHHSPNFCKILCGQVVGHPAYLSCTVSHRSLASFLAGDTTLLAQQLLYTLAPLTNKRMGLTKRMGLARKNEEAAANLQEIERIESTRT